MSTGSLDSNILNALMGFVPATDPPAAPIAKVVELAEPVAPLAAPAPANTAAPVPLAALADIIKPEVLALLQERFDGQDLAHLSVKQLLAESINKQLSGPWRTMPASDQPGELLEGVFAFKDWMQVYYFLACTFDETHRVGRNPIKLVHYYDPNSKDEKNLVVVLHLATIGDGKVLRVDSKDIRLATWVNAKYLEVMDSHMGSPYYFTEPKAEVETLTEPTPAPAAVEHAEPKQFVTPAPVAEESVAVEEPAVLLTEPAAAVEPPPVNNEEPIQLSAPSSELLTVPLEADLIAFEDEDGTKHIRVPVARIGSWKHPVYGEVSFTKEDFSVMERNVALDVLGFEPPLFRGHPQNDGNVEGAPADGFLAGVFTEGDVFYSDYEVVNEEVYNDVKNKRYRYASGEFLRSYMSKETGEDMGITLVGTALTNRPFVPNLPRVSALAESQDCTDAFIALSFDLSIAHQGTPMTSEQPAAIDVAAELKADLAKLTADLTAEYKQALSSLQAQVAQLSQRADKAEAALRQKEIDEKLAFINGLSLKQDMKEKYSQLVKDGTLGEMEGETLERLKKLSDDIRPLMLTQQGQATAVTALNDPTIPDPYKDVVERNMAAAKARKEKLNAFINSQFV